MIESMLSLRCKATGLVVIVSVTATAVVSGYLLHHSGQLSLDQRKEHIVEAASLLSKATASQLNDNDQAGLMDIAKDFANGNPLLYVVISDVEGKQMAVAQHGAQDVLQHLNKQKTDRLSVVGKPSFIMGQSSIPTILDVTYPVTVKIASDQPDTPPSMKLLGYVRTGINADRWERSISSKVDLVIGIGILAAIVAIPLGFLMVRRIVQPLDNLADAMMTFSMGKLDVRSCVNRRDEIGRLARVFNRMADLHQQTHVRIVRLNSELEERVAYRTKQLRELAAREPLTGLYNRRHFNEVIERSFSEAHRYGGDLSCIMIDLDKFKSTNDAFGHQVGDELLMLTATTILSQLRASDVAARYGGDEFIILLPQTDVDRANVLSERIIEKFRRDTAERFPRVTISMSIGVSNLHNTNAKDAEALIRAADHAMYEGKSAGRDCIITASGVPDATLH